MAIKGVSNAERKEKSIKYLNLLLKRIKKNEVDVFEVEEERGNVRIPNTTLGIYEYRDNGERSLSIKFIEKVQ